MDRPNPPQYLAIGEIVAPRGVLGELRVQIISDEPNRFLALTHVYLGPEHTEFSVRRSRVHKGQALLQLFGVDDRDAAEAWRGATVYVSLDEAVPLEEGEFYHYQVLGLDVVTDAGESLGRLREILPTGANDVYVVRGKRGEILLPAIKDVVLEIDLQAGVMRVHLPEGLLD